MPSILTANVPSSLLMTRQEFEHIVPEMRRLMLDVGRDFFGNEMDAEDVAQDGLLQLWRYCERLDEGHNWPALAVRVAKHCCIDIKRRRATPYRPTPSPSLRGRGVDTTSCDELSIGVVTSSLHSREGQGVGLSPSPHEEMERNELKQALDAAIQRLNPAERHLFQLRQLDGLSLDEISEQTHIAKPSAKSMISAARRKLFEAMKAHTDQLPPKKRKP